MTDIFAICPDDRASILTLNDAHVVALSPLDEDSLTSLLAGCFYAARIGDVEAVLIALDETHPTYASPNYRWFKLRYRRFVYVDRIVVAKAGRGKGYARRLYGELIRRAVEAGHDTLVCEVNSDPPNPASDAFHASLGFEEVGSASIGDGAKPVRYLALRIGGQ